MEQVWPFKRNVEASISTTPPTLNTVLALVCAAPGVMVTRVDPVVAVWSQKRAVPLAPDLAASNP